MMWTKIKLVGLLACALAMSGVAQAEEDTLFPDDLIPGEIGAWLGFGSDYNWRGVSQTGDEPSVQAEFDYSVDVTEATSFYISVWGSNVDFGGDDDATVEMDIWGGLTGSLPFADALTWDIGLWGYFWPGYNVDIEFYEIYGGLGYDFGVASVGAYIYYSPDFINSSSDSQYYSGDVSIPLPKGLSLNFHVGKFEFDDNASTGFSNYTDWKVGVGIPLPLAVDLEVAYIDTDANGDAGDCGGLDCDERLFIFVSKTF